jgi:hypothetical protein
MALLPQRHTMVANWPFFLLGLLLILLPRQWMRFGGSLWKKRRVARSKEELWERREHGDPRLRIWREFGKARNYFDLLRGAAGSLALLGGHGIAPSLVPADGWASSERAVTGVIAAILFAGVMIQTIRREGGRLRFYPPIFYLAGLSVGLCGMWAAFFAFALVCTVNPMLTKAQSFLVVYAVIMAVFGFVVGKIEPLQAATILLLGLAPVLLSLLSGRPLAILSRKGFHVEPGGP